MSSSGDLTDESWTLLEPVFNAPGTRGRIRSANEKVAERKSGRCGAT